MLLQGKDGCESIKFDATLIRFDREGRPADMAHEMLHFLYFQQERSAARRECEESYKRANSSMVLYDGEAAEGGMAIVEKSNREFARCIKEVDRGGAGYAGEADASETRQVRST